MSNTIVVAIYARETDALSSVSPFINVNGRNVITHKSPKIHINEHGESVKNFDILIALQYDRKLHAFKDEEWFFCDYRITKEEQLIRYNQIIRDYDMQDVFIPIRTYGVIGETDGEDIDQFYGLKNDQQYVIKTNNGARGLGQMKVSGDVMCPLINDIKNLTRDEIKEKYGYKVKLSNHDDQYEDILKNSENYGGLLVMDAFEPVDEYRVQVYGGCVKFYKRTINNNEDFPQANFSTHNGVSGVTELDYAHNLMKDKAQKEKRQKFKKMMTSLVRVIGSVDVFSIIDDDGNTKYGIFEYCNQYGTDVIGVEARNHLADECVKDIVRKFGFLPSQQTPPTE